MSEDIREPLKVQQRCRQENHQGHDGIPFLFEGKRVLVCRRCGYVLPILRGEPREAPTVKVPK
ncbi:hypothetical protein LCGC14_1781160 [marine sediment metagenome]|uniref:Uncharacterized protein n=1 Tax=marine sediment metagenome TaxID=412755 RepID=A0A0F9HI12_9ZZZZ